MKFTLRDLSSTEVLAYEEGFGNLGTDSSQLSAPERIRTSDLWYRKPMLYPLSYEGGHTEGYHP